MRWRLHNKLASKSLGLTRRTLAQNRSPQQPTPRLSEGQRDRLLGLLRTIKEDLGPQQQAPEVHAGTISDSAAPDALPSSISQHASLSYDESTPFWALRPPKREVKHRRQVQRLKIRQRKIQELLRYGTPVETTHLELPQIIKRPLERSLRPPRERASRRSIIPATFRLSQLRTQRYPLGLVPATFQLSQLRNQRYPLRLNARPLTKILYGYRWKRLVLRRRRQRGIKAGQKSATRKPLIPALYHLPLVSTVKKPLRLTSRPLGERLYNFNRERLRIRRQNGASRLQTVIEKDFEQLSPRKAIDSANVKAANSGIAQSSDVAASVIQASNLNYEQWQTSAHGLPLSPLMDPNLIAARERHRSPKPLPSKELSEYESKLIKCPYGKNPGRHFLYRIRSRMHSTSIGYPRPHVFA